MSREARINAIDAGGRLAPEAERQVTNIENDLTIHAGRTASRAFGHPTVTKSRVDRLSVDRSFSSTGSSAAPRRECLHSAKRL
jgi:hypothetical protein